MLENLTTETAKQLVKVVVNAKLVNEDIQESKWFNFIVFMMPKKVPGAGQMLNTH